MQDLKGKRISVVLQDSVQRTSSAACGKEIVVASVGSGCLRNIAGMVKLEEYLFSSLR
jgi:hypothetical protein